MVFDLLLVQRLSMKTSKLVIFFKYPTLYVPYHHFLFNMTTIWWCKIVFFSRAEWKLVLNVNNSIHTNIFFKWLFIKKKLHILLYFLCIHFVHFLFKNNWPPPPCCTSVIYSSGFDILFLSEAWCAFYILFIEFKKLLSKNWINRKQ